MVVPPLTISTLNYLSVSNLQWSLVTLGLPRKELLREGSSAILFSFLQILSAEQYDSGTVRSRHTIIMSRARRNRNHYLV